MCIQGRWGYSPDYIACCARKPVQKDVGEFPMAIYFLGNTLLMARGKEYNAISNDRGLHSTKAGDFTGKPRLAAIERPCILEAEINPLCVAKAGVGVLAVDALIRLTP